MPGHDFMPDSAKTQIQKVCHGGIIDRAALHQMLTGLTDLVYTSSVACAASAFAKLKVKQNIAPFPALFSAQILPP
jgi:hypothetical protein